MKSTLYSTLFLALFTLGSVVAQKAPRVTKASTLAKREACDCFSGLDMKRLSKQDLDDKATNCITVGLTNHLMDLAKEYGVSDISDEDQMRNMGERFGTELALECPAFLEYAKTLNANGSSSTESPAGGVNDDLSWDPIVEMDNQIFPSYVWATFSWDYLKSETPNPYYYGDTEGQLGIKVTNNSSSNAKVKLVIESPDIMRTSTVEGVLKEKGMEYEMFPDIDYRLDVMSEMKQPRPARVNFSLYINNQLVGTKVKNITLRSINECPYIFVHRGTEVQDQNFMFAAYVNENHPIINSTLLPEVMKSGIISYVGGYQGFATSGEQGVKEVLLQVFSVWNDLQRRGFKYTSITGPSFNNNVYYQYVRSIDDAIASSQANCVDGTVLMASILYRMGIDPLIVLTPGHCYLGFYLSPDKGEDMWERPMLFLETTLLGSKVDESTLEQSTIDVGNSIADDNILTNFRDSYVTFLYALQVATTDFEAGKDKFNADGNLDYRAFPVSFYRKQGLLPINH